MKIAITINDVLRNLSSTLKEAYEDHCKKYQNDIEQFDLTDVSLDMDLESLGDEDIPMEKVKSQVVNYQPTNDFMGLCKKLDLKFEDFDDYLNFMFEDYKFNLFAAQDLYNNETQSALYQYIENQKSLGNEVTIIINDNYTYVKEFDVIDAKTNKLKKTKETDFIDLSYQTFYWLGKNKINVDNILVIYSNKELEVFDLVISADATYKHKNKKEISEIYTFVDFVKDQFKLLETNE